MISGSYCAVFFHFQLTNPEWKPPASGNTFLTHLKEQGKYLPIPKVITVISGVCITCNRQVGGKGAR